MTLRSKVQPIPTTRLGNIDFPRLVMGLHPYDGCSYQDAKRDAQTCAARSILIYLGA